MTRPDVPLIARERITGTPYVRPDGTVVTTPELPATLKPRDADDELRAFLLVVRRALLLVVRYIEHRYPVSPGKEDARSATPQRREHPPQ